MRVRFPGRFLIELLSYEEDDLVLCLPFYGSGAIHVGPIHQYIDERAVDRICEQYARSNYLFASRYETTPMHATSSLIELPKAIKPSRIFCPIRPRRKILLPSRHCYCFVPRILRARTALQYVQRRNGFGTYSSDGIVGGSGNVDNCSAGREDGLRRRQSLK